MVRDIRPCGLIQTARGLRSPMELDFVESVDCSRSYHVFVLLISLTPCVFGAIADALEQAQKHLHLRMAVTMRVGISLHCHATQRASITSLPVCKLLLGRYRVCGRLDASITYPREYTTSEVIRSIRLSKVIAESTHRRPWIKYSLGFNVLIWYWKFSLGRC